MTRSALLLSGAAVLALIWLGPLPALAAGHFSAHMAMHMGVVAIAAPLLALGARAGKGSGSPPATPAIVASVVELVVVWAWHTPALHHAARTTAAALVLEQGMFFASAFAVWFFAVAGGPYASAAAGSGVIALLLTSMHMTLLGALLGLATRPLYPHLASSADALSDQHLGGAIMLLVGGTVYLAGGLAVAARLLRAPNAAPERQA